MYLEEHGVWNGIRWNSQSACFFPLCETDEKEATAKLIRENAECGRRASSPTHSMQEGILRSLSFIEPMKALTVQELPEGDWLYEIKFDGYRALAFKEGKDMRLVSRNKKRSITHNCLMP